MAIHFRASDSKKVPWKNGLGTTLEIATDARHSGDPWTWRLSIADVVTNAPFSPFEGCERFIACLDGGMRLVTKTGVVDVPREGPALQFSGDDDTNGELRGGPCRDLNLIVQRARWQAALELVRGDAERETHAVTTLLVYVVTGRATVEEHGGVGYDVGPGESILLHDHATTIRTAGVVAIASMRAIPRA